MGKVVELQIVLMVDDHGEYVLGKDEESCREIWDEEIDHSSNNVACYQISLALPLPGTSQVAGKVESSGGPLRLVVMNS